MTPLGIETAVDGPGGPQSIGSRDIFSDDLRYLDGTVAGRDGGHCLTVAVGGPTSPLGRQGEKPCTLGFDLFGRGKMTAGGSFEITDLAKGSITFPVLGGTGRFSGAQGEFTVKFAPVIRERRQLLRQLRRKYGECSPTRRR